MKSTHSIASVFLAILIANPFCCCAAQASDGGRQTEVSCCSHRELDLDSPVQGSCECCQVESPRLADGGKAPALFVDLPELAPRSLFAIVPPITERVIAAGISLVVPDSRPPRLLLALQQRFLI